jgi:hypothetical protein
MHPACSHGAPAYTLAMLDMMGLSLLDAFAYNRCAIRCTAPRSCSPPRLLTDGWPVSVRLRSGAPAPRLEGASNPTQRAAEANVLLELPRQQSPAVRAEKVAQRSDDRRGWAGAKAMLRQKARLLRLRRKRCFQLMGMKGRVEVGRTWVSLRLTTHPIPPHDEMSEGSLPQSCVGCDMGCEQEPELGGRRRTEMSGRPGLSEW